MIEDSGDEFTRLAQARDMLRAPTIIGAREMARAASVKTAFLVEGAVPARDLTIITAPPGSMKSWLAYDLALAVVHGRSWLGFQAPLQGKALILNYDNPTAEVGRRMMRLGMTDGDEGKIFFHSVDVGLRLRLPGDGPTLQGLVELLQPRIILIDSMRQSHTADENDSKEMGEVMAQAKSLYAWGASVVIVHHSAKGGAGARGSGEIDGSVTCHISIQDDIAYWQKHRSWEQRPAEMPPWEDGLRFEVTDQGDTTTVRRAAGRPRKGKP